MKWLILSFLLIPTLSLAQQPQAYDPTRMMERFKDPAAMQKMAEEAEAARKCMEGIDQAELDAIQKKAEAASAEIDRLCAAGKKDEALAKGITLSRELRANATVKKLSECSRGMSEMMGDMPWAQMNRTRGLDEEAEPTDDDICSRAPAGE